MAAVFLPSAPAETAGKAAGIRQHLDLTLGKHVPRPLALQSRLNLFGCMNGRVINSSNAAPRVFMTSSIPGGFNMNGFIIPRRKLYTSILRGKNVNLYIATLFT